MQVNTQERSRYVNVPASEVASTWRKHVLAINVVAFFAVVFLAGCFVLTNHPGLIHFVGTLVGYACVFVAQWLLKTREANELAKILTHDCDPAKMAQILDIVMPTIRTKSSRQVFSAWYASCAALMGYSDVALAWASQVEAEAPKNPATRITLINAEASVARSKGDVSELSQLRQRALAIETNARKGTLIKRAANMMLTRIDRHLAFITRDFTRTRELNGANEGLATTPQAVVACEYDKGELEDALGNTEAAWPHFAYVANNGGTLAMRAAAAAWLEAHDPRRHQLDETGTPEEAHDADSQG